MISLSTFAGFMAAIAVLGSAIVMSTDNYLLFVSYSSVVIVLGGTFTATLVSYSFPLLAGAIKTLFVNLLNEDNYKKESHRIIKRAAELNSVYRNGGIAALEGALTAKEQKDQFITLCIELIGTGYKGEELNNMLTESNSSQSHEEERSSKVLETMGAFAPGFGMIGTLIGLIIMLDNLSGDFAELGKGLAIALLTTLYGVCFAQLLFKPAATRAFRRIDDNFQLRELQARSFVLILERKPDLYLKDNLNGFLSSKHRLKEQ
ncbi:motility protein A [Vibrio agarivorans]|uniref:motility protein A n=1 Tax=Vibrio agarivorans TaxID=153622 RepID=UPI0025B608DC|nr:MotA/TolQ/ExbB proton channel family protein [Vibrio agarivorans]MDN3662737.1 MotA/TolQ/ExbB proton channel family protein [Vibrio agarivorans]